MPVRSRRHASVRRRALVPRVPRDRAPSGRPERSSGRRNRHRSREPQGPERPGADPARGCGDVSRLGPVRPRCASGGSSVRRRVLERELPRDTGRGRNCGSLRRTGRRRRSRARAPERQASPGHLSLRGASARGRCGRCSDLRGRRPRCHRGAARALWLRRWGRSSRPGRCAARARRRRRRPRSGRAPRSRMIAPGVFAVDPWSVGETELDLAMLGQTESIFALANGHIGLRANLDEGEPKGVPGTYLNSFYELRPLPYAEAGFGYPESGQTLVNVTDGKIIRLLVDDEPFDVRYGQLLAHERVLDLRAGVLARRVEWASPAGATVRIRSTRLVSFVQRAVAAILYEVEPVGGALRVVVQSELLANEPGAAPTVTDPRAAAVLESPLASDEHFHRPAAALPPPFPKPPGLPIGAREGPRIAGPHRPAGP